MEKQALASAKPKEIPLSICPYFQNLFSVHDVILTSILARI